MFEDTIWISLLITIVVAIIESDTFVFWDLSWTVKINKGDSIYNALVY